MSDGPKNTPASNLGGSPGCLDYKAPERMKTDGSRMKGQFSTAPFRARPGKTPGS